MVCLLFLQSFDWLAAFHLELLQAILFIAVLLSAAVFLATCFQYCSRGLPTTPFPDIHGSGGSLMVSGYGGLGLIPGQSAWECGRQSGTGLSLLRVLQFTVVIILLSLLHTHSFINYRCCIFLAIDRIIQQETLI
jgi:hypothetical protein